ncbi:hypothetical protein QQP08_012321 [Theobroma cacao]|nr:hypothetical protein QQP08_012321 [Theobroma cacao]
MPRFEHTISIPMSVILRKCISMFQELSCLLMDLASVLTSAIRFSSLLARQPSATHRRYYRISSTPVPT